MYGWGSVHRPSPIAHGTDRLTQPWCGVLWTPITAILVPCLLLRAVETVSVKTYIYPTCTCMSRRLSACLIVILNSKATSRPPAPPEVPPRTFVPQRSKLIRNGRAHMDPVVRGRGRSAARPGCTRVGGAVILFLIGRVAVMRAPCASPRSPPRPALPVCHARLACAPVRP